MCSVFGLIDYQNKLTTREKNRFINTLTRECEIRGTDATGIAYHFGGRLRIFKRPLPAHKLRLRVPPGASVVMGHTRMTTQGNEKFNQNNHPFAGSIGGQDLRPCPQRHPVERQAAAGNRAFARKPGVETDSYVAVQLLEKQNALDFASLKTMAEQVEGSFVFTVLDSEDSIWFVKGDNPLCLFHYDGFTLYASTQEILVQAAKRLRLSKPERIQQPEEGEILRIDKFGNQTGGSFIPRTSCAHWWRYSPYYGYPWAVDDVCTTSCSPPRRPWA